jgi:hypothetical protein
MRRLIASRGFEVLDVGRALNRVSVRHLAHLAPFPRRLGASFRRWLAGGRLGAVTIWAPLGNLYLIARRPRSRNS